MPSRTKAALLRLSYWAHDHRHDRLLLIVLLLAAVLGYWTEVDAPEESGKTLLNNQPEGKP